jgi:hypothetical protein
MQGSYARYGAAQRGVQNKRRAFKISSALTQTGHALPIAENKKPRLGCKQGFG